MQPTLAPAPAQSYSSPQLPPRADNETVQIPFTLLQLKSAIPADCFRPVVWKSLYFFFFDWAVVAVLYWVAWRLDSWYFWPAFWLLQGTMFWALFVVGHDAGHGSFSRSRLLNSIIGHICHSPLLVPYHGWRISHRTHHSLTGNADREEAWYPLTENEYRDTPFVIRILRFSPLMLLLFPFYLWRRSPRLDGSHFWPGSDLFKASEKWDVLTSSLWYFAFLGGLGWFTYEFGAMALLKYYIGPYLVFISWLDLVTYLHHTDPDVPWYRNGEWNFVKGALSTVDRDYGVLNEIHHNIGTHIVHHLFINVPHYNLRRATEALKPVLGEFYREAKGSFWKGWFHSMRTCHYVDGNAHTVYYQSAGQALNKDAS